MTKTATKAVTAVKLIDPIYALEKTDADMPAFGLAGGSIHLREGVAIVNGDARVVPADRTVVLPEMVAGKDYVILLSDGGTLEAVDATIEQLADEGVLGGFHFAPGSNATARAGGDDVPAINPLSIWDLDFRPACSDPRGMAYVAAVPGSEHVAPFWADIYLLNVDHLERGTSVCGATIADGYKHLPKVNGGTTKDLNYATAANIMALHGKGLLSLGEFFAAAYGVTEKTAAGDKPLLAGLDAARTSRCGLMQATGNLYVWGHDDDPDTPRASIFGGYWDSDEFAGSRCADVAFWPDYSSEWIGARGRSDHLQLA